jgi:hypothetical protein
LSEDFPPDACLNRLPHPGSANAAVAKPAPLKNSRLFILSPIAKSPAYNYFPLIKYAVTIRVLLHRIQHSEIHIIAEIILPRHDLNARRCAKRLGIAVLKPHTRCGKIIQHGCFIRFAAATAEAFGQRSSAMKNDVFI